MTSNRKYAGLPDLDQAPDIFETPELTDDNSTHPGQSDVTSNDNEESTHPDIDNLRLDPDAARAAFISRRVDARDTDFSDRLDSKRKSYRVSTRRRRKHSDSSDQDTETDGEEVPSKARLQRRIARLQKEAVELKAAVEKQQEHVSTNGEHEDSALEKTSLETINNTIKDLSALSHAGLPSGAAERLALRLSKVTQATDSTSSAEGTAAKDTDTRSSYTLNYTPNFTESHALALSASFDTRLAALESTLGLASLPTVTQSASYIPKPLLPSLDILEKQLDILSSTTPSFADSLATRVRQLTHDAETLDEKRRLAQLSYDEFRTSARDSYSSADAGRANRDSMDSSQLLPATEDPEVANKVNALYGTLPTIENLAPMLPIVVERLKSLRLLHQDAGGAKARLDECEERSQEMGEEIKKWSQGLEAVEKKMVEGETTLQKNMDVIEGWMKDLEGRITELNKDSA